MQRQNRIYESSEVEFDRCSCVKGYFQVDVDPPTIRQLPPQYGCAVQGQALYRAKQRNRNGGLRLAKNIMGSVQKEQQSDNRCRLVLPSSLGPGQQLADKKSRKINYCNYLQGNQHVNFAESHLLQPIEEALTIFSLPDTGHKDKNRLKETALFHENPIPPPYQISSSTKVNSTSSTTLFETRKQNEEMNSRELELQRGVGDRRGRENVLNITDFSRVREVQTVMSSDSFSMSFLDREGDEDGEGEREGDRQLQGEIEREMRKLLGN